MMGAGYPGMMQGMMGKFGTEARPGDWDCSGCGNMNYARGDTCNKCGAPEKTSMSGGFMMGNGMEGWTDEPSGKLETPPVEIVIVDLKSKGLVPEEIIADFSLPEVNLYFHYNFEP